LPLHGPPRTRFSKKGAAPLGGANGKGTGKAGPERDAEIGSNALSGSATRKSAGEGSTVEAVPEAYREAVKRFFSNEPESRNR
jgi:hypothetical protein